MSLSSEQINKFNEDGYLIFDTQLPESILDAIAERLKPYWGHDGAKFEGAPYADFNRIQDGWRVDGILSQLLSFRRSYPFCERCMAVSRSRFKL